MNILPLIIGIWFFCMGFFVFWKNMKSPVNITFALESLSCSIWLFGYGAVYLVRSQETAVILVKLLYCGVIFIPTFFWHFTTEFLKQANQQESTRKNWSILIPYTISIIFAILLFTTNKFIVGVHKFFWGYYAKAGVIHTIFIIFFFFVWIFNVIKLYVWYKKKKGTLIASKIRYVFLAFLIGSLGMLDFMQNYGLQIYPFFSIFVGMGVSMMAYAIVRHQVMDIEVIIRRAAVFAGLFAFAYSVFAGIAYLSQNIFQRLFGLNQWLAMIPSVLIVIFTLRPLERFLINTTDRFLFQKKYDYKILLKTFSGEVLTVLDLSKLVKVTVENLSKIIRLESCSVLIYDKDKDNYPISASLGLKEANQIFTKNTQLINYLLKTHHYLLKDKNIANLPDTGTVKEDLKKLNAELILPIIFHDELMGAVTLGRKKSGEEFTQDDLDILLPLSQTLAVAISNAQYFLELGKTQAEAAQREKMAVIGTLASGINHEICNPLGIARGQCEAFLLNKKDGIYNDKTDTEQLNEAMRIMELVIKETDRATSITKKLSTFAKPSKGEVADDVDISKEMDEVIGLVGYELKLDKIELVKNIPPGLSHIRADKKQLQEIFFNLIRNAAQAITESGRITISAHEEGDVSLNKETGTPFKIQPTLPEKSVPNLSEKRPQPTKVIIDIADTGCGIPEDKLGMIFNPFYTTKEPGKGTGLGLFIVRQVVERNKGKISLKSKVGEGTTFTLEFPIAS